MLRKFKDLFAQDENGKARNWVALEEHRIKEINVEARDAVMMQINHFKYIEIDYEAIRSISLVSDEAASPTPGSGIDFGSQSPRQPMRRRTTRGNSVIYDKLLSELELNRVRDKFKQDVDAALEDAIRKH